MFLHRIINQQWLKKSDPIWIALFFMPTNESNHVTNDYHLCLNIEDQM